MKKKNILNLIKYHVEENDLGFRDEAYEIAKTFDSMGDYQLAEYIIALLSNANTFIPQASSDDLSSFQKVDVSGTPLPVPELIKDDIIGIINAVGHNVGINKFLFEGAPGTGKTESVKHVARIMGRDLYGVDFTRIVDSKLGQTSKNISDLFDEINNLSHPENVLILFDEIDAISLDRTDANDLREMGRATTSVLKGLDGLNDRVVLIATTNLFEHFDKALVRRFDSVIDFNRYSRDDLLEISEFLVDFYLNKFKFAGRNIRIFRKIMSLMDKLPYPADLENMIKVSIAFSNPGDEYDYLKKLYFTIVGKDGLELQEMKEKGFTLREIEFLTGVSKSQVSRELKR